MTWTDDVPYWVQVILLPKFNNYLLLAIKNFSSKMNLSSHHVMAYLVHEEKKKKHQFYIAVQKMYGWYNSGHNNKVLKELNVTPTSDGYMVFLFWKNVTVHQTINMLLLYDGKKLLNRGFTISVTSHYSKRGLQERIYPLYPLFSMR